MAEVRLDCEWLRAHPLPCPSGTIDKNSRGRVLVCGGSACVPGGLLLTAEAAFRAGAGKVQIATIRSASLALGVAMPEAAIVPLSETAEGEIAGLAGELDVALDHCDTLVVGPAMGCGEAAGRIIDGLANLKPEFSLILDAAALTTLASHASNLAAFQGRLVLTPHIGEMAAMLDCEAAEIEANRPAALRRAVKRFGAVVVFKGSSTWIAAPGSEIFHFAGGSAGLATSGSGDVLCGLVAGQTARGVPALEAALWSVWLHGEAGQRAAEEIGRTGFLARELLPRVPRLMNSVL